MNSAARSVWHTPSNCSHDCRLTSLHDLGGDSPSITWSDSVPFSSVIPSDTISATLSRKLRDSTTATEAEIIQTAAEMGSRLFRCDLIHSILGLLANLHRQLNKRRDSDKHSSQLTDQPLEQLPQRPLVGLESHVKRDRNQVRVYLRRIITDQRPLEDEGAVDFIVVRRLNVKLAWKWVGESVVHVQEPRRRDEISEPA